MPSYAKLRRDLVSSSTEIDGAVVFNVKDPLTGTYFRLREPEFWLINQLDGETAYDVIARNFRDKFDLDISAENVEQFVGALEKLFFLENTRSEQAVSRRSYGAERRRSLFSRLLFIKLKAFDPTRILNRLTSFYRPFHRWYWVVLQMAVIFLGAGLLSANFSYFAVNLIEIFNIGSIVAIVLAFFILVTLHELAHAVICRYHGGEVKSMGFLLLYFQPCFYTDLSDAWLFKNKSHRLAVTWAGPYFQLIVMAVAVIVWRVTVIGTFPNELARLTGIVCWVTLLFNLNPLIKLDGYYLLSDWVDIPNLRKKAFAYFGNVIRRRVLGWSVPAVEVTPRQRKIFLAYASLALLYSVFLIAYILVLLSRFLMAKMGGGGLILLAVVLIFTLRSNIADFARGIIKHIVLMRQLTKRPLRLITYVVILAALVIILFAVPFPHRVSGEVKVLPIEEFVLSINDLGYLESRYRQGGAMPDNKVSFLQMSTDDMSVLDLLPLVKDGQRVQPGDTIAILSSSQVAREIVAETSELERLENELNLLKAPPQKHEIAEAEADVDAATANYEQRMRDLGRFQDLAAKGLIPTEQVESAQSAADIASAELTNRRSRLQLLQSPPRPEEEAVLRAGIDKQKARVRFLKLQKDAQQIITPIKGGVAATRSRGNILTVVNNDSVELLVPVSDFNISLVEVNQPVKVMARSYPGATFDGKVVHVPKGASNTDEGGARFLVSVVVPNEDMILADGVTGYAKIEIGKASLFNLIARKVTSFVRVEFWSWW